MDDQITYQKMCEVIAADWNREQKDKKNDFTWQEIWNFPLIKKFPALYCPTLYDAAKTGDLIGLLLTDNTCAGMFMKAMDKRGHK